MCSPAIALKLSGVETEKEPTTNSPLIKTANSRLHGIICNTKEKLITYFDT